MTREFSPFEECVNCCIPYKCDRDPETGQFITHEYNMFGPQTEKVCLAECSNECMHNHFVGMHKYCGDMVEPFRIIKRKNSFRF